MPVIQVILVIQAMQVMQVIQVSLTYMCEWTFELFILNISVSKIWVNENNSQVIKGIDMFIFSILPTTTEYSRLSTVFGEN